MLLLLPIAPGGATLDPAGILYALAAGVGWALYIVFGQKAGRVHGPSASTWGLMIAALVTVPVGLADAGSQLFDPAVLPFGLGVAVFSSALPYTLEMIALRRLSTKTFGTLMSFEPAIAAIAGFLILREHLTGHSGSPSPPSSPRRSVRSPASRRMSTTSAPTSPLMSEGHLRDHLPLTRLARRP